MPTIRVTFSKAASTCFRALTVDYEFNDLRDLGEQREDLRTHLTTVGARLALNPRVQLSAFYQYNSFDKQRRWNIRGSWEYRPLSFVYLLFSDTRIDGLENPLEEQQLIGEGYFFETVLAKIKTF